MPFAKLGFATLRDPFVEIRALEALAVLTGLRELVVLGELRGVYPGIMVGFAELGVATNNSTVTHGVTSVSGSPVRLFVRGCVAVVLHFGAFSALLASPPLPFEDMRSSF